MTVPASDVDGINVFLLNYIAANGGANVTCVALAARSRRMSHA